MSTVVSAVSLLHVLPAVSLKPLRFLSASSLQWNSWPAPDPLMFHAPEVTLTRMPSLWAGELFSYAKINDGVLRWKRSLHQRHLYPLSHLSLYILLPTCLCYKLVPPPHMNQQWWQCIPDLISCWSSPIMSLYILQDRNHTYLHIFHHLSWLTPSRFLMCISSGNHLDWSSS